jgi:hypothetical protein
MSSRRPQDTRSDEVAQRLRTELEQLKNQAIAAEVAGTAAEASQAQVDGHSTFDQLSGAEQAAGSLGVHPEAWKPIK